MNAFCAKCQVELKCHKNGAMAVQMAQHGPNEARSCDIYRCPGCGFEVATAFAVKPYIGQDVEPEEMTRRLIGLGFTSRVVPFWLNAREKEEAAANTNIHPALRPKAAEKPEPVAASRTGNEIWGTPTRGGYSASSDNEEG